ncbi:thioesterase family protein [Rhodococcus sp. UNC363MFTsu5.1]|uniref:thioesterase family protein n=1 Tax=Rhodococcus sp. UNC363MFTsu5.1 TaxID=1449069 RepID=UPI000482113D|nr:thioesterase family protein [Rhodococcus sp. UNC363MFTsu5.1]
MTQPATLTSIRPFADLTTLTDLGGGAYAALIDPIWTIGPKVHGGCMMALCAAAAREVIRAPQEESGTARPVDTRAMQPIAVSASYLNAPDPGEVRLITTVRKRGRQVCLVDVDLMQGEKVAVSAVVTLGVPDVGDPRHQEPLALADLPAVPPADAVHITPDHPMGQIVHVAKGCDLRVDPSAALFLSGQQGDPVNRMWVRPFAEDEVDTDVAVLFALMTGDISAPVTMNRGMFGWAPTVQLTTYLRRLPSPGWLRVMASATVLGDTWFEEDHLVLDEAGQAVVQSRQLAMIPKG